MRRPRSGRRRLAAAAALAALAVTAGCGDPPKEPQSGGPGATFDSALHERLPDEIRRDGVLRVATDASYAPASFFAPDGRTVVGFEADLLAELARVLGVEVEMVITDFGKALDEVEAHRVDVVVSAMTDTLDREQHADFVNYFSAGTSVVVQRGNPTGIADLADLCGKVVAVETGTVHVDLLARSQGRCSRDPIEVREHRTNADALVELRTGRAAAVLNDYPPAAYLVSDERTRGDYQLASNVQYEPGLYGIAVARDRTRLRDALQAGLERLLATGAYERVLSDWDVEDGALDTIGVNAGG